MHNRRFYIGVFSIVVCLSLAILLFRSSTPKPDTNHPLGRASYTSPQNVPSAHPGSTSFRQAGNLQLHQQIEAAPAWTIPYGQEFWRPGSRSDRRAISNSSQPVNENINLGDVIDRVSHPILWPEAEQYPAIHARTYSATFDGEGFRLHPHKFAGERREERQSEWEGERPREPKRIPIFEKDPTVEAAFRTTAIRVGNNTLYSADSSTSGSATVSVAPGGVPRAVSWSFLGNTAQGMLNSSLGLIEHYETSSDGVEVTWVLNHRPPQSGDLLIEAELTGLNHAGQDEHGHHYADATGTPRVKVGKATLVDFEGVRIEVPLIAQAEKLRLTIPELTIANLGFPIAIDPLVSPEYPESFCVTATTEWRPAAAWNGTNYLVVWEDESGRLPPPDDGTHTIYGTRVTSAGKVLDPLGIGIATNNSGQQAPSVASDGSDYFVVWDDAAFIKGSRVRWDGVVLDSGLSICDEGGDTPEVACQGTNYLVVWYDGRAWFGNAYDLYAARVSTSGAVLDPDGFPIQTNGMVYPWSVYARPGVASDGTNYLVTWPDGQDPWGTYAARVTATGIVLDFGGVLVSSNTYDPVVAFAKQANSYLVVSLTNSGVSANRVTTSNGIQTLDGNGNLLYTSDPCSSLGVASNGTNYLIAASHGGPNYRNDILGIRVRASDGVLLGTNRISTIQETEHTPDVASDGNGYLVVWPTGNDYGLGDESGGNIFGARVTDAGVALDLIPLSTTEADNDTQRYVSVAATGSGSGTYFAAWEDQRNFSASGIDIYGARIRDDGLPMDVCGIPVCTFTGAQERPNVAASPGPEPNHFLVTWMDKRGGTYYDIYGARVTNGLVAETNGFVISSATNNQQYPAGYSLAGDYFVAWQDQRIAGFDIYGARVTASGSVLDTSGIVISATSPNERFPKISGMASNYFVVWISNTNNYDVFGARVHTNGTVVDSPGIAIQVHSSNDYYPDLANDGTNYLVAWQHLTGSGNWDIFGKRVSQTGTILDSSPIEISTVTNSQEFPAVACRASAGEFLVAWGDWRNTATGSDIYGARVTSAGTILDTNGFAIDVNANFQYNPAVATRSDKYLVLFHSYRLSPTVPRIKGRLITP